DGCKTACGGDRRRRGQGAGDSLHAQKRVPLGADHRGENGAQSARTGDRLADASAGKRKWQTCLTRTSLSASTRARLSSRPWPLTWAAGKLPMHRFSTITGLRRTDRPASPLIRPGRTAPPRCASLVKRSKVSPVALLLSPSPARATAHGS